MAFWWRNTSSPMWIKDKGGGGPFQAGRIVQEPEGACVFRYDKQNGQGRGGLGGVGIRRHQVQSIETLVRQAEGLRLETGDSGLKCPARGLSASA